MCAMLLIWDIFSLIHHDHSGLTYHGGYWAFWPRIRRSTQGVRDCDPFHLPFRAVLYPYPYPDSMDIDDLPILSLTWHHLLVPLYDLYHSYSHSNIIVPLPILSIISLIWPGSVWDGLTWGELYTKIDGSWWESGLIAWRCCWGRGVVMEHLDLSHYTWL